MRSLYVGLLGIGTSVALAGIILMLTIGTAIHFETKTGVLGENSTAPDLEVIPTIYSERSLELQIHDKVNQYRNQNNVTSLEWSDGLAEMARSHSLDMNMGNYFAHDGNDGTVLERSQRSGFDVCGEAELIIQLNDYEEKNKKFEHDKILQIDRIKQINMMTDNYNVKQKEYEKNLLYENTFNKGDDISNLRIQKEYSELNKSYKELQQKENILRDEDQRLIKVYNNLESQGKDLDIAISEHRVGLGVGENLGYVFAMVERSESIVGNNTTWLDPQISVNVIVDGWINSAEHRRNLLNPSYQSEGIGVSINRETSQILVTQEFC